ncbi:MAG: fructose-1,6-bisphosphatase [Candidatus Limiplasma sp.]|nr:fructose-1,6-bisphosphatase [Candidatus Limiplasma sp.]
MNQGKNDGQVKHLTFLAKQYPNIKSVSTEIINLQAILNLPKGTEHFLSDIHGEYESFSHVMRNASGVIKTYIKELFGNTMRESEISSLSTLVYYPKEKLRLVKRQEQNMLDWYRITMYRLIKLCRRAASKYTRSKVRKSIDPNFSYIMEELLQEDGESKYKHDYYHQIINTIIDLGRADDYIIELSKVIQRLSIDRLHIIGDIYDRGPYADKIMQELTRHHSLDIQWGNHDILWMGAAMGSVACIMNVLRICAKHGNLHTLEDGYGINLVPFVTYAMEYYSAGDFSRFKPEIAAGRILSAKEEHQAAQVHKAAAVLQFKVEAEIIGRHPEYHMADRLVLHTIQRDPLDFPTVDPQNPYQISTEEADILDKLSGAFQNSTILRKHIDLLFSKGSMYLIFNGNLLLHGCIPMNDDGTMKSVKVGNEIYNGKGLLDAMEQKVRDGYHGKAGSLARQDGQDMMWYLWCGADSPLYGSDKMTTFERCFLDDPKTHIENRVPYYSIRNREAVCNQILENFGLDPKTAHIINGHVPVKVAKGESPVKANGRLLVIDGGFAKAYQKSTGIAGYTLIYNSHGLVLVSHEPFESTQKAIEDELDIHSSTFIVEYCNERVKVKQTDTGVALQESIDDLMKLLHLYETGAIKEEMVPAV